jgi:cytochrome c oxidase assembly factor CtaG
MTTLPPLTPARLVTTWHFDFWAAIFVVVLLAVYLAGVRAARRHAGTWPLMRTVWFVTLGLGTVVVATMSSLAVYSTVLFWPMALRLTLLLTVVPIGFGLGDPLGLVDASTSPATSACWHRVLSSRPLRALTFPAVAPVLAVATQFVVFYSGYIDAALHHSWVMSLLQLQLVVTGCLFAVPMLGVGALPAWCTQPVRMTFAAFDGLLDAIPGIAVMTSSALLAGGYYSTVDRSWGPTPSWDQTIGGGLMLTVAEVIAIPFVAILFRAWIREDARTAAVVDRVLDEAEPTASGREASAGRPWWEVDPGPLADRAARFGWQDGGEQP